VAHPDPCIRIRNVCRTFGGVQALLDVSLDLYSGEIHALCGENGAGKSTLIRILSGVLPPDSGEILAWERPLPFGHVHAVRELGIAAIHQETPIFPDLTAAENVCAGREPRRCGGLLLDRRTMRSRSLEVLERLGGGIDPDRPAGALPAAGRQMVSIANALWRDCRYLILDEPTSSLSARECEALFERLRQLRQAGVGILYVSHRLEEVFELADRITVLRDGRLVDTRPAGELTEHDLIRLMVGREMGPVRPREKRRAPGPERLRVEGLTRPGEFKDLSFSVRSGEIVGLAGLVGAGRSEAARCIFGLTAPSAGTVTLHGRAIAHGRRGVRDPAQAARRGIAYVPEDRRREGLVLGLSVRENALFVSHRVLPGWASLVSPGRERSRTRDLIREFDIRCQDPETPAGNLSGGNQQKVLLARWLSLNPEVLILDEPTRGVDVGAKAEIHGLIRRMAENGAAVLLISSEMPELLALCDRILVMREGRLVGELSAGDASAERVLSLALPGRTEEDDGEPHSDAGPDEVRKSAPPERSPHGHLLLRCLGKREVPLAAVLAVMFIAAGMVNPAFFTFRNQMDLLSNASAAAIVACGLCLVIASAEIDISVGSMMGLLAAVLGQLSSTSRLGWPTPAAVAAVILLGGALGLVNGVLVAAAGVPSIIVTLGMLTVLRGLTEVVMHGEWITDLPPALRLLGSGTLLGAPASVWCAGASAILVWCVARWTPLGMHVFAVGSNPEAARLQGISQSRVRLFTFTLTGLLTGVATVVTAPQQSVIESGIGVGFELLVVTCVVLGGTSIMGGVGSVTGAVLAALLLTALRTVLIFLHLGESAVYWERSIQGLLILVAIVADYVMRRRTSLRPGADAGP